MVSLQQAMLTQSRIELCRMRRLHLRERHTQRSRIVAEAAHRRLDGDGIDLAEERIDEIGIVDLHLYRRAHIAVKIMLTYIMCHARRNIRQHGDHTRTAKRQNRYNLVIVAGVDRKIIARRCAQTQDRREIAARLLHADDAAKALHTSPS